MEQESEGIGQQMEPSFLILGGLVGGETKHPVSIKMAGGG